MRILVTAGATREPLDDVRFLSNVSTGATGAALADALVARGHRVALLRGTGSAAPNRVRDIEVFTTALDLEKRLRARLAAGSIDAVIMAAAVADYRPVRRTPGKISSDTPALTIRLVRNPKILPRLKRFTKRPLTVVGFKLTSGATPAARDRAVAAQFRHAKVDIAVGNDLSEIRPRRHPFLVHWDRGLSRKSIHGAIALAALLEKLLIRRTDALRPSRPRRTSR